MLSEQIHLYLIYMNAVIREVSSSLNLSLSQYYTLLSIQVEGITMSELSLIVGIDNSTLTRNIDKLIIRKLVIKSQSTSDKREFIITLSPSGGSTIKQIDHKMSNLIDDLLVDIDNHSKNIFKDILEKINWKLHCKINEV